MRKKRDFERIVFLKKITPVVSAREYLNISQCRAKNLLNALIGYLAKNFWIPEKFFAKANKSPPTDNKHTRQIRRATHEILALFRSAPGRLFP